MVPNLSHGITFGILAGMYSGTTSQTLNNTSKAVFYRVTPTASTTITSISLRFSKTGSPGDVSIYLSPIDATGALDRSGEVLVGVLAAASVPTSSAAITTIPLGTAYGGAADATVTGGTTYCIELRAAVQDASNNIAMQLGYSGTSPNCSATTGGYPLPGGGYCTTYPTVAGQYYGAMGLMATFADGSVFGCVWSNTYESFNHPSDTKECGIRFTSPSWLRVAGVCLALQKAGTGSANNPVVRVYVNGTVVGEGKYPITPYMFGAASMSQLHIPLATPVIIAKNDVVQLTLYEGAASSSTNYNRLGMYGLVDDTNRTNPLGDSAVKITRTTGDWTVTNTQLPAMGVVLDLSDPFPQPPLNRRQFNSMR